MYMTLRQPNQIPLIAKKWSYVKKSSIVIIFWTFPLCFP
jgi:hypothetical protein